MEYRRILLLVLACSALLCCSGSPAETDGPRAGMTLAEAMSPGDTSGFLRAVGPHEISFPASHGPHPGFQTEWWYVVGNLRAGERRFGYQLTFFRSSLRPPSSGQTPASRWATDDVLMAHFALSDIEGDRFLGFERLSRAALDLAGARAEPFRVWVEDWVVESSGSETFPLRLRASEGVVEVDLQLQAGKPPVLQGDAGLSQKGERAGNASYYYSLTRLPTRGVVRIGEELFEVEGASWMDREWSTSALEEDQVGWDWFALQLSDERDLMVYRMRLAGDLTAPQSSGVVVDASGGHRRLLARDFTIEVTEWWRSAATGVRYPAGWRIVSAAAEVDLTVTPMLAEQEHRESVVYWEGAVNVAGKSQGRPVQGSGYVELTGYQTADAGVAPGGR